MGYGILILGLVVGEPATGHDGRWLVEYDPGRDGWDPVLQVPMLAHVVSTGDASQARRFPSAQAVHECWTQVDPRQPVRWDGRPNRPLTAYTIEVRQLD